MIKRLNDFILKDDDFAFVVGIFLLLLIVILVSLLLAFIYNVIKKIYQKKMVEKYGEKAWLHESFFEPDVYSSLLLGAFLLICLSAIFFFGVILYRILYNAFGG